MPASEQEQQQRDNDGVLFVNIYKKQGNQPDYRGTATVASQVYKVSGWVKTPKDDSKKNFLSLSFTPQQDQQAADPSLAPPEFQATPCDEAAMPPSESGVQDDLPF